MSEALSIIGSLSGVIALVVHIWNWWSNRQEQNQGASAQRERDDSIARSAETQIAMAEANAPRTDAEVANTLRNGTL